jgi:hypothetical protein
MAQDSTATAAYIARKAELEALRKQRELAEAEQRKLEQDELSALLEADSKAERDALKGFIESRPTLMGFLAEFSIFAYDAGPETNIPSAEHGLVVKLVERSFGKGSKSTKPSSNGSGSGNGVTGTNFDVKTAAIRPRTKELLEAKFGTTLSGDVDVEALTSGSNKGHGRLSADGLVWQSRRKLCLALGIAKDDQHPDGTLMKLGTSSNPPIPVKEDWEDSAYQKEQGARDLIAEYKASTSTEPTTTPEPEPTDADKPAEGKSKKEKA